MNIIRGEKIFQKECQEYFVVLNLKHNALFMFHKDVEIVWKHITPQSTLEKLYEQLFIEGYSIEKNELFEIIELFAKLGIVIVPGIAEDFEVIRKNDQFEAYIDYCSTVGVPTVLHIETTNMCNLKCVHCFHDELTSSIELSDIEKVFDELEHSAFVRVTLTGGELGLHPAWKDIMDCAKSHGLSVAILSNLTRFNEDDLLYITNYNPLFVRTSIYGFQALTHNKITGCDGSYERTFANLLKLKNNGVNVGVSCTVMQENFSEIFDLKDMMEVYDIPIEFGCSIWPSRKNTKTVETLMVNHSQYMELYNAGILNNLVKIPCNAGAHRIAIDQNGEIYCCDSLRITIGNIKNTTIIDALKSEKMKEIRHKIDLYFPEKCKTCDRESICTKCPGLVWNYEPFVNVHSDMQCFYTTVFSCRK